MMKKRGRFIAGFAALMMAVMLTGCGGSKYEEVVATTAAVEQTAAVEATKQAVVLEIEKEEIVTLQSAGFIPVTLGKRILRTETAGLAAVSAFMSLYGEME